MSPVWAYPIWPASWPVSEAARPAPDSGPQVLRIGRRQRTARVSARLRRDFGDVGDRVRLHLPGCDGPEVFARF
jgi:hypothetical protein